MLYRGFHRQEAHLSLEQLVSVPLGTWVLLAFLYGAKELLKLTCDQVQNFSPKVPNQCPCSPPGPHTGGTGETFCLLVYPYTPVVPLPSSLPCWSSSDRAVEVVRSGGVVCGCGCSWVSPSPSSPTTSASSSTCPRPTCPASPGRPSSSRPLPVVAPVVSWEDRAEWRREDALPDRNVRKLSDQLWAVGCTIPETTNTLGEYRLITTSKKKLGKLLDRHSTPAVRERIFGQLYPPVKVNKPTVSAALKH